MNQPIIIIYYLLLFVFFVFLDVPIIKYDCPRLAYTGGPFSPRRLRRIDYQSQHRGSTEYRINTPG